MYYFIDGYNLLFTWSEDQHSLEVSRKQLIRWLQEQFSRASLHGTLVFDGAHRREEESGLSYPSPLEVAFAPKNQTADEYILEQAELYANKKIPFTLVTNDRNLQRRLRGKSMSNSMFLRWISAKTKSKKPKNRILKETPAQMERLLKIFEERLKDDLENGE